MTESEWLTCADPVLMLEFLRGKASDRKLRLFAVACCRRIWHLFRDERSRKAIEVAERFADGTATEEELNHAEGDANDVWNEMAYADGDVTDAETDAADAACAAACYAEGAIGAAVSAFRSAANAVSYEGQQLLEQESQCRLLRDLFGDVFRSVTFSPIWRTLEVIDLAQAIYYEQAFDHAPVLADALEKAGCHDADILAHCRHLGLHARGCWVVDAVLGKA